MAGWLYLMLLSGTLKKGWNGRLYVYFNPVKTGGNNAYSVKMLQSPEIKGLWATSSAIITQ